MSRVSPPENLSVNFGVDHVVVQGGKPVVTLPLKRTSAFFCYFRSSFSKLLIRGGMHMVGRLSVDKEDVEQQDGKGGGGLSRGGEGCSDWV